ncbi:redoxin domain-containing protein [Candidatus Amesbacteria bacterium]|nr:redoxin domain-containing protein [Candidatus Amesbacteria bacterium]
MGKKLPNLSLSAYYQNDIKEIKLGDYKGKWLVLIFYPADFTFICPTELEEAAMYYPQFKKLDAEIMSVSTDTGFAHKAWHDSSPSIKKIEFPMLSDPTGKLCRLLGTYIEEEGLSLRATFIIDPTQTIKAYDVHDNSIGRSTEEIIRKLQAAKFVKEHKSLVCPASWKPGKKTLKPGIGLVGKI